MRILYGILAAFIWTMFLGWLAASGCTFGSYPIEVIILSIAIVSAGAMAGGS